MQTTPRSIAPSLTLLLALAAAPPASGQVEPVGLDREIAVPAGALTDFVLMAVRPSVGVSLELTVRPDPERGLLYTVAVGNLGPSATSRGGRDPARLRSRGPGRRLRGGGRKAHHSGQKGL